MNGLIAQSLGELQDNEEDQGMTTPDIAKLEADAAWGKALWDWLRDFLPDACVCIEIDTEDLMRLASKHGMAKKVPYDPAKHGEISEAEPGDEIWWWGDQSV